MGYVERVQMRDRQDANHFSVSTVHTWVTVGLTRAQSRHKAGLAFWHSGILGTATPLKAT